MNKKLIQHSLLIAIIMLLQQVNSQAQIRDVKWEPFLQHPCYKGLSVSVLNMGWSNDTKTYLWGVRIKNNYNTTVSFRYLLNVGDEKKNVTKYYYEAADKLKPGDTLTNGEDALRGIEFKNSSAEWTVMIGDVCFDGMRCGGEDDCYADCDVSARKVNQPCGLEAHTSTKKEEVEEKSKEEEEKEEEPAEESTKPAEETNGDKYSFKGTTIWKSSYGSFTLYAIIDNFLYEINEGGGPWWHNNNLFQLRDMKSFYPKKAPDTYERISSKEYREIIKFIDSDKIQNDNYHKNGKKIFRTYTYSLVGNWSAESLPQATKQTISPSDINGIWNFEPEYTKHLKKIPFNLLSQEGDKIVLTRKYVDTETFTYKRTSTNTYEYKPENIAGTARIVFLSPTRICLSYVYKNYVSIGYYNKPIVPIVKEENKPTSVTENKTEAGSTQITSYNGLWRRVGVPRLDKPFPNGIIDIPISFIKTEQRTDIKRQATDELMCGCSGTDVSSPINSIDWAYTKYLKKKTAETFSYDTDGESCDEFKLIYISNDRLRAIINTCIDGVVYPSTTEFERIK